MTYLSYPECWYHPVINLLPLLDVPAFPSCPPIYCFFLRSFSHFRCFCHILNQMRAIESTASENTATLISLYERVPRLVQLAEVTLCDRTVLVWSHTGEDRNPDEYTGWQRPIVILIHPCVLSSRKQSIGMVQTVIVVFVAGQFHE